MFPTRSSLNRWATLMKLTERLEACFEVTARLDAHARLSKKPGEVNDMTALVESRLKALTHRIEQEVDLLTAERLRVELATKQAQAKEVAS